MKLEKILKSELLFYIAVILMVINVVAYVSVGSMECVIIFAVTTYVANYFTKNRALDIFAGLLVANLLFGCSVVIKENFGHNGNSNGGEKASGKGTNTSGAGSKLTQAWCSLQGKIMKNGKCVKRADKRKNR